MRDDDSIEAGSGATPPSSDPAQEPQVGAEPTSPRPSQAAEEPIEGARLSLWERIKQMVGR
jgi:hypothetical protein